jgi:hypothetical protein
MLSPKRFRSDGHAIASWGMFWIASTGAKSPGTRIASALWVQLSLRERHHPSVIPHHIILLDEVEGRLDVPLQPHLNCVYSHEATQKIVWSLRASTTLCPTCVILRCAVWHENVRKTIGQGCNIAKTRVRGVYLLMEWKDKRPKDGTLAAAKQVAPGCDKIRSFSRSSWVPKLLDRDPVRPRPNYALFVRGSYYSCVL